MRSLLYAVLLFFAATDFVAAQDLSSFHATAEKLAAAFNKSDVEAITQAYADDARIFPPGRDIIQGRDAVKAFWVDDV
jgi:ketosteroid isomerase-like protein